MNYFKNIKMANPISLWKDGNATNITLSITEQCNLACKYCYMVGKNSTNKMTVEIAKKTIDYVLQNRGQDNVENVIWEFIGGEPFLEIDLIDKVCDYIKLETQKLNHPWADNYMLSFTTNGLLYSTEKVQNFIKKNSDHISVCMSVDGNKIKHDLQRVYPDGRGSYNDVVKNVPLWMQQFPHQATKATFSHDDLPYLKDSIISLWELGIKTVLANLVYEDVWEDGDDDLFEEQLK
ncbi:MAG: radical SAM protein, partial [Paraclostridium sp.]